MDIFTWILLGVAALLVLFWIVSAPGSFLFWTLVAVVLCIVVALAEPRKRAR